LQSGQPASGSVTTLNAECSITASNPLSADGNTIVGYTGTNGPGYEGPTRGFVATIPEPRAAPLLGLLIAARRRRRPARQ